VGVFSHEPVLLEAVVDHLAPERGGTFVDCTLGGGGHAEALLQRMGPHGRLLGIDRDPQALAAAQARLKRFGDRVIVARGDFRDLAGILDRVGIERIDGALFDLGLSSHQLDRPERGFSYWGAVPLDMRMDPDAAKSAADLLAELDEGSLARIIKEYGEERWADRIARFIVAARRERPIRTADQLVELIKAAIPAAARREGPHPARRTFQALRIAVNDELEAVKLGLRAAIDRLEGGGRVGVISFHSLEDKIVKKELAREAQGCVCPPDFPECRCDRRPRLKILTRRPVTPTGQEIERNPRARSAKLRVAERVLGEKETE